MPELEKQVQAQVAEAFAFADAAPYPDVTEVLTDVE
jgi:TPP-dependent pyruvate/acetoin dehydrogenase alpha subunit